MICCCSLAGTQVCNTCRNNVNPQNFEQFLYKPMPVYIDQTWNLDFLKQIITEPNEEVIIKLKELNEILKKIIKDTPRQI